MKSDAASITHYIQAIVGPSVKVQLPPGDMEHLLTLEGDHFALGIKQAALSQLRYFNAKPEQQAALSHHIAKRIEQLEMQKKQLEKQQYGDYWNHNPIVKLHDCYICKDTGWVCDYSSGRYACDCKKGIEKTATQQYGNQTGYADYDKCAHCGKTIVKNPDLGVYEAEWIHQDGWVACNSPTGTVATSRFLSTGNQTVTVMAAMAQQSANSLVSSVAGILGGTAGAGAALPTPVRHTSVSKAPVIVVELPPVVGRKFRGVGK